MTLEVLFDVGGLVEGHPAVVYSAGELMLLLGCMTFIDRQWPGVIPGDGYAHETISLPARQS